MKFLGKFVSRLLAFLLPIWILGVAHLTVGISIGEILLFRNALHQLDNDQRAVYQPLWQRESLIQFKFEGVLAANPDIIVLGSSRVLFFRDDFFNLQPEAFYNVSIQGLKPEEAHDFVEGMIRANVIPEVILLELDLPYFNEDEHDLSGNRVTSVVPSIWTDYQYLQSASQRIGAMWLSEPLQLLNYYRNDGQIHTIGLYARQFQIGYLKDGSYYHSTIIENRAQAVMSQLEDFAHGRRIYERGTDVNRSRLAEIEAILSQSQQHGIAIIGFLSTYQPQIYNQIVSSSQLGYMGIATSELEQLFSNYNMPFYDFSDPQTVQATDDEFMDTWHPGELVSFRQYLTILEDNQSLLGQYSDYNALIQVLSQIDDPFYWFEPKQ